MKFCIQNCYRGKERTAISNDPEVDIVYSPSPIEGTIPIGTIEYVEKMIGIQKPDYFPDFTKPIWNRNIYFGDDVYKQTKPLFIKPSDRHKRFDGYVVPNASKLHKGHIVASEIVSFEDEWRYYILNGEVVCSWWYDGDDQTCEDDPHGRDLTEYIDIPKDFCGTIDVGIQDGKFTLVECHKPYAIGWYGEMTHDSCKDYIKFISESFLNYYQK